jgi:molybdopterin molybdotransferase
MRGFVKRHDIEDVLNILKKRLRPEKIIKAYSECLGYISAEDIVSSVNVPAFRRSTMDGYALRAKDTFGASLTNVLRLSIIGKQYAGESHEFDLKENECIRVMTGGMIPDKADSVLMAEYTEQVRSKIKISAAVSPGKNVSQIGEDIKKGEVVFSKGHKIRPQDVGVLASIRKKNIFVLKKPSIALIITGDEVVDVSTEPEKGQIVDSISPMMKALAKKYGYKLNFIGILKDDEKKIKMTIENCTENIILTTGATSVGEMDVVPKIVSQIGDLVVHGVSMRPGAPMGLGFIKEKPIFLLPGNPAAAMICFDRFVYSTLLIMQGMEPTLPYQKQMGTLSRKVASALGRTDFVRVKYKNGKVDPIRVSGSSILTTMTRSNGYIVIDRNAEGLEEGSETEVYLYE